MPWTIVSIVHKRSVGQQKTGFSLPTVSMRDLSAPRSQTRDSRGVKGEPFGSRLEFTVDIKSHENIQSLVVINQIFCPVNHPVPTSACLFRHLDSSVVSTKPTCTSLALASIISHFPVKHSANILVLPRPFCDPDCNRWQQRTAPINSSIEKRGFF